MTRRAAPALIALVVIACDTSPPVWTMRGGGAERRAASDRPGPRQGKRVWRKALPDDEVPFAIWPLLVGRGGDVIIPLERSLVAVDSGGSRRWRRLLEDAGAIAGAPAIHPSGEIYVPTEAGGIVVLGPGGRELRRLPVTSGALVSVLLLGDERVVYATDDGSLALIGTDGAESWSVGLDATREIAADLALDRLYVPTRSGLRAVELAGGETLWSTLINWAGSPVVGRSSMVFVPTNRSVVALTPDGTPAWSYPVAEASGPARIAIAPDDTLIVAADATLQSIEPGGTLRWQVMLGGGQRFHDPLVDADGVTYVSWGACCLGLGQSGAYGPDGALLWEHIDSDVATIMALGPGGRGYSVIYGPELWAFE